MGMKKSIISFTLILIMSLFFGNTTALAMGNDSTSLDPSPWEGAGPGQESIHMIDNYSIVLTDDGVFQLNAPDLIGDFAYIVQSESGFYAEADSVYKIFPSKTAARDYSVSHGWTGFDNSGEGTGCDLVDANGIFPANDKYICLFIIETPDYADQVTFSAWGQNYNLKANSGMTYGWADYLVPYGVYFADPGHGLARPHAISYENDVVTLPELTAPEGYVFEGWYTAEENGTKIGNGGDTVSWQLPELAGYKNTKLFAKFSEVPNPAEPPKTDPPELEKPADKPVEQPAKQTTPSQPKAARTGDGTMSFIWIGLLMMSGILLIHGTRKQRR